MRKLNILGLLLCFLLVGCGSADDVTTDKEPESVVEATVEPATEPTTELSVQPTPTPEVKQTPVEVLGEKTLDANFKNGCPSAFSASGDWSNGDMFNVTWRKTNVKFEDELCKLIIDNDPKGGKIPYSGGELRSKDFYGYGRYEVSMKPIKNDGVVSSFFTYTGPSDKNPWDEIDIEFLGKDTTQVQFNYFHDGKGNHEKLYDLGFDASEDFHTYAFEWRATSITWFVDGEEVYKAQTAIPKTPGKIMANAWCGTGVDSWLKAFDDSNLPLTAEYEWISFSPFITTYQ